MIVKVAVPEKFKLKVVPDFRTLIFGGQKEIHYIGGTDVLPPPLENEKEEEVIGRLGTEDDQEAKKLLIEHNLRLVVYIAKKFDNTGVGVEDLISIGTIGLIKAINTFNPTKKIKLATYASRCIENEILMYLRRNSKTKLEVSIDEPLNVDWDGNELLLSDILGTDEDTIYKDLENEAERKILFRALNKLSGREKMIVRMRFGLDHPEGKEMTQKEVADLLGISQSYISRLEKKIMTITDSQGKESIFHFDSKDRLIHKKDPTGLTWDFVYEQDNIHFPTKITDPKGTISECHYDARGNPIYFKNSAETEEKQKSFLKQKNMVL